MDLEKFYAEHIKFKAKQKEQRLRGLNDFNVFSAVLPITDEVRLHSGFIYSLLNPNGEHNQGTLFLELFLDEVGLADFINIQLASVRKEYKCIDLHITDGENYIIIENKIYAKDQDQQITHYIKAIEDGIKKNNVQSSGNILDRIAVIYLSPDRDKPSENSIKGYALQEDYLIDEGKTRRVQFNAIKYKNEIRNWLHSSLLEVSNLTNLNFAISQYIEVIEKLYGEYKGKVMILNDFVGKDLGKWKVVKEIGENYDRMLVDAIQAIAREELLNFFKNRIDYPDKLLSCNLREDKGVSKAKDICIDFYLENQVIIQLEYDLRMILCKMTVQFYSFKHSASADKSMPQDETFQSQLNDFPGMDIIEFICDKDAIQRWIDGHESCLSKFNALVNGYKDI